MTGYKPVSGQQQTIQIFFSRFLYLVISNLLLVPPVVYVKNICKKLRKYKLVWESLGGGLKEEIMCKNVEKYAKNWDGVWKCAKIEKVLESVWKNKKVCRKLAKYEKKCPKLRKCTKAHPWMLHTFIFASNFFLITHIMKYSYTVKAA